MSPIAGAQSTQSVEAHRAFNRDSQPSRARACHRNRGVSPPLRMDGKRSLLGEAMTHTQLDFPTPSRFDSANMERLISLLGRVYRHMRDGRPHTLREIAEACKC